MICIVKRFLHLKQRLECGGGRLRMSFSHFSEFAFRRPDSLQLLDLRRAGMRLIVSLGLPIGLLHPLEEPALLPMLTSHVEFARGREAFCGAE